MQTIALLESSELGFVDGAVSGYATMSARERRCRESASSSE
jgi:hypothetical protein